MIDDNNEIRYTNDDMPTQDIRYTNDDIPYNEKLTVDETATYREVNDSGETVREEARSSVRFSDFDVQKVASTFVVAALVSMVVVFDDSPFGEFFDPIMGDISEAFGISGVDPGYRITCEIILTPGTDYIEYEVIFDGEVPEGVKYIQVSQGSSQLAKYSLDEYMHGSAVDLLPGTTYTFTVTVDGKTAGAPQKCTTLGSTSTPIVKVISSTSNLYTNLETQSPTEPDFVFQLSVVDQGGICSDFQYELSYTDSSSNEHTTGTVAFSGSATDVQEVDVDTDEWFPNGLSDISGQVFGYLTVSWTESGEPNSFTETVYL